MSERKGINKYYPPDWDPSKVPKKKKSVNQDIKVRLMAPFSMRCLKCNEYISARRKFNARKEITKDKYMNFKIIRFHITCPRCNNNITFRTDPQTADYVPESGAVRNYEPSKKPAEVPKDRQETEEEILERLQREDKEDKAYQFLKEMRKKNPFWQKAESLKDQSGDLMENLENRLQDQQRQQVINDHIELLQLRSSQLQSKGGVDKALDEARNKIEQEISDLKNFQQELFDQEDDEIAKNAFRKYKSDLAGTDVIENRPESPESTASNKRSYTEIDVSRNEPITRKRFSQKITLKKKPTQPVASNNTHSQLPPDSCSTLPLQKEKAINGGLGDFIGNYSSDEDENE